NNIHDTGVSPASSKLYHTIYVGENTNHVEVAWNNIHDNHSCYTVQFFTAGYSPLFDLSVHDNLIHHDNCAGITRASVDPPQGKVEAYSNVRYDVGNGATPPDGMGANGCLFVPGYVEAGPTPSGTVEFYNNTCYNVGGNPAAGSSQGAYFRDTT